MFENMTYNAIMKRCLDRVPANIDKREGSLIYDALAPAAAELAQAFITLSTLKDDYAFPDTVTGENLTKKAMERSVIRHEATAAMRHAVFKTGEGIEMDVPIGGRYSGGTLNFVVTEKMSAGHFKMACETPGVGGNQYFGPLIPIEYVQNLGSAELLEVLIPGEDQESDDELRKRYFESLHGQNFGGNIRDYELWVTAISGVGGVRVYPIWNGGGTVKLVIISSEWGVPASELVDLVQTQMDPEINQGVGLGTAPIGHTVTVQPVEGVTLNISAEIVLLGGTTWQSIKPKAEQTIREYFTELCKSWAEVDAVTVRISQIETRILSLDGVVDISSTKINGSEANATLTPEQIPLFGTVSAV